MRKILLTLLLTLAAGSSFAAFDGTGTFNRLYNWQSDKASAIPVTASRMDAEMDGFATGLSTCVTKDGQTTITGNLPMSGFRHTGVGNATARTDYPAVSQVQDNKFCYGAETGSVNAYAIAPTIAPSAYAAGQVFWVNVGNTNTASATLNISSLGAKAIKKGGTTAVDAGDLVSGTVYPLFYDGTNFQMVGAIPPAAVSYSILTGIPTQLASVSNTGSISLTNLTMAGTITGTTGISTSSGGYASATYLYGQQASVTTIVANLVSGTGAGNTLSATNINAANISATNVSVGGNTITSAFIPVATALISTTSSSCSVLSGNNVSGCIRTGLGGYNVSFTTPMSNTTYKVICYLTYGSQSAPVATVPSSAVNRTDSFYTGAYAPSTYIDNNRIACVVYP